MKPELFLIFLFILVSNLFSGQIEFSKEYKNFQIFNKKNNKISKYYLVRKNKELRFSTVDIDTLKIFTRIIIKDENINSYQYDLTLEDEHKIIEKTVNKSNISKGLGGETVSSYNLYKYPMNDPNRKIVLKNLSDVELLVKISAKKYAQSNRNIDFIRYSPEKYEHEEILTIDDRSYTCYTSNSRSIEFTLEGPILLKIISRMIFDNNLINRLNYRYYVYDNDALLMTFEDNAYKSKKAILKNDRTKIPSTGDTNIIKLEKGLHHIRIEDTDSNRNLLFRFYISKSAIGISTE